MSLVQKVLVLWLKFGVMVNLCMGFFVGVGQGVLYCIGVEVMLVGCDDGVGVDEVDVVWLGIVMFGGEFFGGQYDYVYVFGVYCLVESQQQEVIVKLFVELILVQRCVWCWVIGFWVGCLGVGIWCVEG